jgi:uncharacterized membrane protein YraQ (UPF0718 family)
MEVLVAGLVVLALSAGTLRAFVVGRPDLATAATVFCGVFVQALPFLAFGVVISGLIAAYVSPDRLARWLPRRTGAAILTAGVGGAALPGCESSATFGGTDLVVKMTTTKIATTGPGMHTGPRWCGCWPCPSP